MLGLHTLVNWMTADLTHSKIPTSSIRMSSIQCILLILCIAVGLLYLMGGQKGEEGYVGYVGPVEPVQGMLPRAKQVSMIPRDSASATTSNPQLAKPDYRDWATARDSFMYFLEVYKPDTAIVSGKQADITAMLMDAPRFIADIEKFILNPEAVPSRDILERGAEAQELANAMRRVGPADPWSLGWERPGNVSACDDNLMGS